MTDPTPDLVERVARAIERELYGYREEVIDARVVRAARAAIAALATLIGEGHGRH